ncbi:universal stress protein [Streptomyces sp. NPDC017943]|uniref:universal stress protein n=1 Tax=Streptomyces sp. NPDC017943 TaxID=3365019 RepID=UPI0037A795CA
MRSPVLACVDGSECAAAAAAWAAGEARLRGVALRLLHVSPRLPGAAVPVSAADRLREIGTRLVRRTAEDLTTRCPEPDVDGVQTDGDPAEAVLDDAARGAGLLVAGTRGTGGFPDLVVGSTALRLAAAAPCPVVLVPPRPGAFSGGPVAGRGAPPVVLGFDAHRPVGAAADFAFSTAELRASRLRVVQAWVLPAESVSPRSFVVTEEDRATWEDREVLDLSDALRPWQEKYPQVRATLDLRLLHPAQALLNASRDADLLVVGRSAEAQPAGRLGPVAHAVLHHVRRPVAVVPPGA